ncbi:MAG: TonB-dependent receptor [Candidatus Acidiferrum sp.]
MKLRLSLSVVLLVFSIPSGSRAQTPATPAPDTSSPPAAAPADTPPQTPTVTATAPLNSFEISGTVRSGKTPLPGVTVTAANTLTGKKFSVATASNGTYSFTGLPRGRYVVRVEFMAFAPQTQEVILKPETPTGKFDAELILASRQQEQSPTASAIAAIAAGRGFQSLSVENTLATLAGGDVATAGGGQGGGAGAGDIASLPMNGAGVDSATESVSITGAQGRSQDFGAGSEDDLQNRIQEFRQRAQQEGLIPGGPGGGPGGGQGGGGFGGAGPISIGRLGRGFNVNQPHGFLYFSDDNADFDAKPYALTGLETPKASYNFARFGANVGGPLNIPKIFNGGNKWFFFAGWNGSRGSTPVDSFSTVPTAAERAGNFSSTTYRDGSPVQIFDPTTGEQLSYNGVLNAINPGLISPAAETLLQYIPLPNLPGTTQNFHYVTNDNSNTDAVSIRLIHNFTSTPTFGPFGGGAPGGGGGRGGGGRRAQNNINFGLNWSRNSTETVGAFPSLAGNTNTQGLQATSGWTYGNGRRTNTLRFTYNHNHVSTSNLYSNAVDVAGLAGIGGVSTDPFDFGIPSLSFTDFSGLSNPIARRELDQTYTISDTLVYYRGKHNLRLGGDYRRILQSFRSAKNAEGSFVFTGLETSEFVPGTTQPVNNTGYDFADFLLGVPQQTSLQSGTNSYNFASNSFDLFAQDDYRIFSKLSLNLGVRYEYNGPFTETHNQVSNLDVAPGFTAATPVLPGEAGPYNGGYPDSLIRPDRHDWAPRIGIAWRPLKQTVVRAGYGINYNLAQYATMAQNFAFQPPFAITSTNVTSAATPLTLANGFPSVAPGAVTNNFAVDPNYHIGYVQIWNLDIQRTLPHSFLLNVDYNGSKGTDLDTERAIEIPGIQPFIYESSASDSIFHAGSVRIRKRMAHGIGFQATYIYSKSIDDASSVGGGSLIVIQNPFDIAADRSLSAFDQRHKFTGSWMTDLPFGENRRFLQKGVWSHILSSWQLSGDFTVASGLPFTPNVLGNSLDLNRGVSGSLRADVTGQPIALSNPTAAEWFNTAAFCSPSSSAGTTNTCVNPNGTPYGDAGRNIIEGPWDVVVDMSLSKTITIKESRSLELRLQAANVFNFIDYTSINTTVNSQQFGQVTTAGATRRITFVMRFRF